MFSVCRNFFERRVLVLDDGIQGSRVASHRPRSKKIIVCRKNQPWILNCARPHLADLGMLIVPRHELGSGNVVSRYQTLNLIQHSHGIKGVHFRFEAMCFQPNSVTVSFALLSTLTGISQALEAEFPAFRIVEHIQANSGGAWVVNYPIPEPGSAAPLLLGTGLCVRRRR